MRIAYVGCGFVFDIYMRTQWAHAELEVQGIYDIDLARAQKVSEYYGHRLYESYDALLKDDRVDIVVNLTNISAHYEVTKRALLAGKHVYSEKPLTTELAETQELFALAKEKGVILSGAPCNVFSDAVATMWKCVRDGAIGKPVLVYAELDDSPVHLMRSETWRSPTGAPWPYIEEFQEGCTFEHVGYHLVWICAMFGPAIGLSAFSSALIEHKTDTPLSPADTPDFSVACIEFANGVVARVTCSIVAPRDHRMRIIGTEGEVAADSYRHFQSSVKLERFSNVSLAARKAYTIRSQPLIGKIFGVGGKSVKLVRQWKSHAVESDGDNIQSIKHRVISAVRRREVYSQDKLIGIAEMARSIENGLPQILPADFLIHVNELTLLIQRAGTGGGATPITTKFKPLSPPPALSDHPTSYLTSYRQSPLERALARFVRSMSS